METMKIKWMDEGTNGQFQNKKGKAVALPGNFRCAYNGKEMLCIWKPKRGAWDTIYNEPVFVDAVTLSPVEIETGEYIEIDREEPARCAARREEAEKKREEKKAEEARKFQEKYGDLGGPFGPARTKNGDFWQLRFFNGWLDGAVKLAGIDLCDLMLKAAVERVDADAKGDFVPRHYSEERGDVIFNPLKGKGGRRK